MLSKQSKSVVLLLNALSRFKYFKNYAYKFYIASIIGVLIPVLSAIFIWLFVDINSNNEIPLLSLLTLVTIASISIIIYIQIKLVEPLLYTGSSLKDYIKYKDKSLLPNKFDNNLEDMLKKLKETIEIVDTLHQDRKDIHFIISTELREKITGIINYCQLMANSNSTEEKQKIKKEITKLSKQLLALIDSVDGILNLDEIKIAKSIIHNIELDSLLRTIKEDYADEIHRKKLSVELVGDIKLIKGEEALLKQVFHNIIGNAVKYSNSGGTITIDSEKLDDSVIVKIKDNGIGFKPENKDAIFNQFTNVRKRGTLGESTTGIDLFIAKKIIDKHSGSIEANSEGEGKGAEFIVKLPD